MDQTTDKVINLTEILSIIKRNLAIIISIVLFFILLSGAFLLAREVPYNAEALISVESISSLTDYLGLNNDLEPITYELQLLTSNSILEKALLRLELESYQRKFGSDFSEIFQTETGKKNFQESIKVSPIDGSNIIRINITNSNKKFVKDFLETLINVFSSELKEQSSKQLEDKRRLLVIQLENLHNKLDEANKNFENFLNESKIISVSNNDNFQNTNNEVIQNILTFFRLMMESNTTSNVYGDMVEVDLIKNFRENNEILIENYKNAYRTYSYDIIIKSIFTNSVSNSNAINQYDVIEETYKLASSQVRNALLLQVPDSELDRIFSYLIKKLNYDVISEEEIKFKDDINQIPIFEQYKSNYIKEIENLTTLSFKLAEQLNTLNAFINQDQQSLKLVEDINVTKSENDSFILLILAAGLIIGLVFGVALAVLLELSSRKVNFAKECALLFSNKVPILGVVPFSRFIDRQLNDDFINYNSTVRNTYDQIASILLSGSISIKKNIYCLSGISRNFENTIVNLNIGFSLAKSGQKVAILGLDNSDDCQEIFSKINSKFLYKDILSFNEVSIRQQSIIPKIDLPLTFFNIVLSSSLELSQTLHSQEFKSYVESLTAKYDIILINAPTYHNPIDQFSVAQISNGLIVTFKLGYELKREVKAMVQSLYLSKIPVIGLILVDQSRRQLFVRK